MGVLAAASVACACQTGEPVAGGATAPSSAPHDPPLVAPYVITACPPGGSVSAERRIVWPLVVTSPAVEVVQPAASTVTRAVHPEGLRA